jgi:hypothetical protein
MITLEQKQTIITAAKLFGTAADQLPAMVRQLSLLNSLVSDKNLGGKIREALLAIQEEDAQALGAAMKEANAPLWQAYQIIEQLPTYVGLIEALATQAAELKPSLNPTEPQEP